MIIGLMGHAGSGKDTLADMLTANPRVRMGVKQSLSDPMKRFCQEVYGFTDQQLWGPSQYRNEPDPRYPRPCPKCYGKGKRRWDMTCLHCNGTGVDCLSPREALQRLGTEWGRVCYPDTWIDLGVRTAAKLSAGGYTVIIPDVRFKNELEKIKAAGGVVWRIRRPGAEGGVGLAAHASEIEQDSIPDAAFAVVLDNNGSLNDLLWHALAALP